MDLKKKMEQLEEQLIEMRALLAEAADDAEDDDPDATVALQDKKQAEFEKKNKKKLDAANSAVDKAIAAKAKKPAAEPSKTESKPLAKQTEKAAVDNPDKKKEKEAPAEDSAAKTRGRKAGERGTILRTWFHDHDGCTRGEFIKFAADQGCSKAHANTLFYALKGKKTVSECFYITHPLASNMVLCESRNMGNHTEWKDLSDPDAVFCLFEANELEFKREIMRLKSASVHNLLD